MVDPQIANVASAVVASVIYSIVFFVKSKEGIDLDDGDFEVEEFDIRKFGATVIVGIGVGISMALTGTSPSFESLSTELAAYAGIIAVVESSLKIIHRKARKKFK